MTAPGMRNKPRQDRSERTVEAILDAADHVFSKVGVHSATTTMIAEQAGLSIGALYRFYKDKTALAEALSERYMFGGIELYGQVHTVLKAGGPDAMSDAVRIMVEGVAGQFKKHPGYFAVSRHLDSGAAGKPAHHNRKAQIDALSSWFEGTPNDPDEKTRRRVAEFLIDTTRVLIERVPARGKARQDHLDDIVQLVVPYLRHHLG